MLGRGRRLSVVAALLTAPSARPRSGGVARGSTGTIEAGRREASRSAVPPTSRSLGMRLARRRAIADAARGAS